MSNKFEKRKTVLYTSKIYKDSYVKFIGYLEFILKQTKLGNRIPSRVMMEFFSCIKTRKAVDDDRKLFISELVKEAKNKFPEYDFNGKNEIGLNDIDHLPEEKKIKKEKDFFRLTNYEYSFEEMLYKVYDAITKEMIKDISLEKDMCIGIASFEMKKYRHTFKRKHFKYLSDYKIGVLSSYIASSLGYAVYTYKNPTKEQLFHSSRNAIKKYEKQKALNIST